MGVILPAFLLLVGFAMEAATSHYQSSGWFEGLPCQDSGLSVRELYLDCSSLGNCSTVECLLHDFIDDYGSGTESGGSEGVVGTASFYVHNCSVDPVIVDVSVSVPGLGIEDFHHEFTESGTVYSDPSNSNGPVMVEMSRNATHLQLVVESFYNEEAVYLIPLVHVPLNASQCMCESLKNLSQYSCTKNSACNGVQCDIDGLSYTVDLLVLSCDDPPGIGITILDPDGTDIYMGTFDQTQSIPIPPVGNLKVSILHHDYSMDVEINIVSFRSVNILPRQTIILDQSNCSVQPSTPPPTEVPAETCAAIENITSASIFCKANPGCSSVECTVPVTGHHIEMGVLPCNTPPALHVTVQDPDGLVLYDNILTNSAMVPIQANGFTFFNLDVTILQSETMDAVTVKVDVVLPIGGRRNIVPETTIPINRTACPVTLPTQSTTEPGTGNPPTESRCQTMEEIAVGLEEVLNMPCSRSDSPCYDVECVSVNETERNVKLTILNCDNPPSVRLIDKEEDKNINFNHTFTNSDVVPLVVVGDEAVQLNVTVNRVNNKNIGLQIVLLTFGSATVLVPYTLIPLDDSGCVSASSTSSNKPVVAIVVPVGVVLCILVAALLVVVVFLVWRRRRKNRLFEPVRLTDVDQEEDED